MTHPAIAKQNTAQAEFDAKYITASEIMKHLGVTRFVLSYARTTNKIPPPHIILNDGKLFIWEREIVQPYLDAWKSSTNASQGV